MEKYFQNARAASITCAQTDADGRNAAINSIADELESKIAEIVSANAEDLLSAKSNGIAEAMLDRLMLDEKRIRGIASDARKVAKLPDPLAKEIDSWTVESGLKIQKVPVPFGVIGVIYEARPNVTVDVAVLCLKTGNACLLKGGKEAKNTNEKLVEIMRNAIAKTLNKDCIQLLPSVRESAETLIKARGKVDLIVPRGGKGLIEYVVNNSTVPVIETGSGVCSIYISKYADKEKAINILLNAKTSRPSVCNAVETVLIDEEIKKEILPEIKRTMIENGVTLHAEGELKTELSAENLGKNGYNTEFDSLDLTVKIVRGVAEAVKHINEYGTHHSDAIVSENAREIEYFLNYTDSACVYSNASTRFSDGGCFGFGAELGISTQKLHARGPMGLKEMTTYKYKIIGSGQIR